MTDIHSPRAEFRILSAGAVRAGLLDCLAAFAARTGRHGCAEFDTAAAVARTFAEDNGIAEAVVLPYEALQQLYRRGCVARAPQVTVGEIAVGAVVRCGTPAPKIGSVAALTAAIRAADTVICNRASSGLAIMGLLKRLGMLEDIGRRIVEVETGRVVVESVAGGRHGRALGFAQSTEICRVIAEGVQATFLGTLSEEAAITTRYMAARTARIVPAAARLFVRFLATVEAHEILARSGIAWPPRPS